MRSHWQLALSVVLTATLSGVEQLAAAGRIPPRNTRTLKPRDLDYDVVAIEVPGLESLYQYVCPNDANNPKPQITGSPTISLPRDQLRDLLLRIRTLELKLVDLIDFVLLEDGLGPANSSDFDNSSFTVTPTPSTPTPTIIPLVQPSSPVDRAVSTTSPLTQSTLSTASLSLAQFTSGADPAVSTTSPLTQSTPLPIPLSLAQFSPAADRVVSTTSPLTQSTLSQSPLSSAQLNSAADTAVSTTSPPSQSTPLPIPFSMAQFSSAPDSAVSTTSSGCCENTTTSTIETTITTTEQRTTSITASFTRMASLNALATSNLTRVIALNASITANLTRVVALKTSTPVSLSRVGALNTSTAANLTTVATRTSATANLPSVTSLDTSIVDTSSSSSSLNPTSVDALSTATSESSLPPSTTELSGTSNGGVFIQTATGSSTAPEVTGNSDTSGSQSHGGQPYTFNSQSSENIAVYFGQTPVTGGTTLAAQCADPNIDIVILAFVISISQGGQYPQVNFGAACGAQTPEMVAQAPGLLYCPELASYIDTCQQTYGKKVLLSIGGATSQISFSTPTQASDFADMLWKLFGPTGNVDLALRPFGNSSIDGFDVDNEDNMPANFDVLASTLRTHYASDTSKSYYLSSAPQCPFPDASNPSGLLLLCDFVFVQFYNNPQCEIDSAGFEASVTTWSTALQASTLDVKPMLYVGAPAFAEAGPSAYAKIGDAQGMKSVAHDVKKMGLSNFGGVMFWDGPEGMLNEKGGKDIIEWAKDGLTS